MSESGISSLEHVIITLSFAVITSEVFNLTDYYEAQTDDAVSMDDWLQDPHPRRGDIKIELVSPSGTTSVLLPYRNYDFINDVGYDNWPFMSVHFWGENPVGDWTLQTTYRSSRGSVYLANVSMTTFGANGDFLHDANRKSCDTCLRGCLEICDVCCGLRNNISLACVNTCPSGTSEYNGYCIEGDIIYPPSTSDDTNSATVIVLVVVAAILVTSLTAIALVVALVIRWRRKQSRIVDINYTLLDREDVAEV